MESSSPRILTPNHPVAQTSRNYPDIAWPTISRRPINPSVTAVIQKYIRFPLFFNQCDTTAIELSSASKHRQQITITGAQMTGSLYAANAVEAEARMDVPNRNQQPRRKSRADNSSAKGFKRAYKACVRCRMSKAKCELPEPADSSLPLGPCSKVSSAKPPRANACFWITLTYPIQVKCQRERRKCEFTVTRSSKKRQKPSNGQPDSLDSERPHHG